MEKFDQNVRRDQTTIRKIRGLGWNVATVWSCEARDPEKLAITLAKLFATLDDSNN